MPCRNANTVSQAQDDIQNRSFWILFLKSHPNCGKITPMNTSDFQTEYVRARAEWIDRYLQAYLSPILHCFYQYDLVFMPHGENLILKLEDDVPVGCFMKDIGEEIAILDTSRELPDKIKRIKAEVPDELKLLSIFVDVFSCFFRFISAILDEDGVMQEGAFWQRVAVSIEHYQQHHPQFSDKFAQFDLFSPTYAHSCLNRLQLANNQQMVNLDDPASALKLAGVLVNPIAQFKK